MGTVYSGTSRDEDSGPFYREFGCFHMYYCHFDFNVLAIVESWVALQRPSVSYNLT